MNGSLGEASSTKIIKKKVAEREKLYQERTSELSLVSLLAFAVGHS